MKEEFGLLKRDFYVYFVGVGGISMSALARFLVKTGFRVGGYDAHFSSVTENLQREGVEINNPDSITRCDLAVVSSAISDSDKIVCELRRLKKPIITRARLLYEIASSYPFKIGVAGTHGKTTCTAMIAHVLKCANKGFCAHIGGFDKQFGNMLISGEDIFLSEVCEFKKNISMFTASLGVLLNIDNDHLDSYGSKEKLKEEFGAFLNRSKIRILPLEEANLVDDGITFSLENSNANYYAKEIEYLDNRAIECFIMENGKRIFKLELKSFLIHDIKNALACVAACRAIGIEPSIIKAGLENYCGVKRRNEIMGKIDNCVIYADYAHHPAQVEKTVKMLDLKYDNYAVLFQSHTYSRTAGLYKQFLTVLSKVKNLFIFDTYAAREKYTYMGSGKRLSEDLKGCIYCQSSKNVSAILKGITGKFECVAVLGAGDLYDEVEKIIK